MDNDYHGITLWIIKLSWIIDNVLSWMIIDNHGLTWDNSGIIMGYNGQC